MIMLYISQTHFLTVPTTNEPYSALKIVLHMVNYHYSNQVILIQIQTDGREGNTGFYLVRPTKPGIEMHRKAIELSEKSTSTTNQVLHIF